MKSLAVFGLVLLVAATAGWNTAFAYDIVLPDGSGRIVTVYPGGGFEADVSCGTNMQYDALYAPTSLYLKIDQDNVSRYYKSEISWSGHGFFSYFADTPQSGFKVKINMYNYQDAPAKGWGPSYGSPAARITGSLPSWLASMVAFRCDLPNCFREIGDFSRTYTPAPGPQPSFVEFEEPLFGYGMSDGRDAEGNPLLKELRDYAFSSRMPSGRGNKSLMKVRFTTTTWIGANTLYNIFQCRDNKATHFLKYDNSDPSLPFKLPQRVFAPNCIRWYYADPSGHSFNSATFC